MGPGPSSTKGTPTFLIRSSAHPRLAINTPSAYSAPQNTPTRSLQSPPWSNRDFANLWALLLRIVSELVKGGGRPETYLRWFDFLAPWNSFSYLIVGRGFHKCRRSDNPGGVLDHHYIEFLACNFWVFDFLTHQLKSNWEEVLDWILVCVIPFPIFLDLGIISFILIFTVPLKI